MKTTNNYESQYGEAYEYATKNGYKFYTVEYSNSGYMDFYKDEESCLEALNSGVPNENRVESVENYFLNDNTEIGFYMFLAAFITCGDIKKAFDAIDEVRPYLENVSGLCC